MRLPSPMLSRSGPIPTGDYAYELKFDGFRRSWDTTAFFEVRSRRGWNMTDRLPELGDLPAGCVFDGEIVRFEDGVPHFPLVCGRLLHADRRLPLAYLIFDLLAVDGEPITGRPYRERRVEGVVANRRGQRYRPGERAWVKTKNRDYWRYPEELQSLRRAIEAACSRETFDLVR